jgi:hypothetical protein
MNDRVENHPCYRAAVRIIESAQTLESMEVPDTVKSDCWLKSAYGMFPLCLAVDFERETDKVAAEELTATYNTLRTLHDHAIKKAQEYML